MRLALPLALVLAVAAPAAGQNSGAEQGGTGSAPIGPPSDTLNREAPPPPTPPAPSAAQGCADPTFSGKYTQELRRIAVPRDLGRYGRCRDYGRWSGNTYEGHTNLPNGFWVYSYPEWIIYAVRAR